MKKILIVTRSLNTGGVETSLISMLKCIPQDKYKVKVITLYPGGELLSKIPSWVEVEVAPHIGLKTSSKLLNSIKNLEIRNTWKILLHTILGKKSKTICESYKHSLKTLPIVEDEYDLAISYYNPTSFTIAYTIDNVRANKKVMWIHNDVNLYNDIYEYNEYYKKYDYIYNVSKSGANKFINKFPELKEKVSVFYNIIDQEMIEKKSNDIKNVFSNKSQEFCILTVARLSIEKGQDLIPSITRKLLDSGYKIKWYCIGEGQLRREIEQNIQNNNVMNNVILLGNKENPYPYIKECDLYVQTSRSECYCTTVMEAKCLNKPMIITDVNGSSEQIDHGKNGIITNCNVDDIYNSISYLLDNPQIREKFSKKLAQNKINTNSEMEKLYNIL